MENSQPIPATQPTPVPESNEARYWREHFSHWRESGVSQSEYCHRAGLSRHKFKYWRRKLEPSTLKRRRKKRDSGFVPLQVQPAPQAWGLSLSLPNGMVLRGIEAGNVDLVTRLVSKL